jgi:hypothetical protein
VPPRDDASLSERLAALADYLHKPLDEIMNRTITVEGVGCVRERCVETAWVLIEQFREDMSTRSSSDDLEERGTDVVRRVNEKLRVVREALGDLKDVLERTNEAKTAKRRRPSDHERMHGRAESSVEELLVVLNELSTSRSGTHGMVFRKGPRQITVRVDDASFEGIHHMGTG